MNFKRMIMLCLCLFLLVLGGCGKDQDYNGYSAEDLKSNSQGLITALSGMSESDKASYLASGNEMTVALINDWSSVTEEYGAFQSFGDFHVEQTKDLITATQEVDLEQRSAKVVVVFQKDTMEMTDVSVEPIFSLGETMKKAGVNTVMGIGVVFSVLILISLLIYSFKWIKKSGTSAQGEETTEAAFVSPPFENVQVPKAARIPLAEEEELVAVIAAAIAAAEGMSLDDFVVRSIRRRK